MGPGFNCAQGQHVKVEQCRDGCSGGKRRWQSSGRDSHSTDALSSYSLGDQVAGSSPPYLLSDLAMLVVSAHGSGLLVHVITALVLVALKYSTLRYASTHTVPGCSRATRRVRVVLL